MNQHRAPKHPFLRTGSARNRYEAVNTMLLNEFIKEHRQVQEQQKQIEKLAAQLKEQAEQIQKVNDKVEMNRPAPQIIVDDGEFV
jgi:hypothetical protein